jgi:hypothetical protein
MKIKSLKQLLEERKIERISKFKKKETIIKALQMLDKTPEDMKSIYSLIEDTPSSKKSSIVRSLIDSLRSDKEEIIFDKEINVIPKHLCDILEYFERNSEIILECFEKSHIINSHISGKLGRQGGGLSSAVFVDMFVTDFLEEELGEFKTYRQGEADCMILDNPLSFKKICPKKSDPSIALDWSKNKEKSEKEYFTDDIMIFSFKSLKSKLFKNDIPTGIYLIPKDFCKKNITLKENNKTNSLIDKKSLMKMMDESFKKKLFLPIHIPSNPRWTWNISKGFTSCLKQ